MKLGIIGGSGFYHLPGLVITDRLDIATPFGSPSAPIVTGTLGNTDIVFLPRHGSGHIHPPSRLPYRANVHALKQLDVTHLLSINAVGSLTESMPPLTIGLPDQIIDRTVQRDRSFFDDGIVAHVGLADPFCSHFGDQIASAARSADIDLVRGGTYVCIEGPQFSTKAESRLYRSWGASVIGMTAMPEARLAREAELCYASLALVTDFDVWHDDEAPVTVEIVRSRIGANTAAAVRIVTELAHTGLSARECGCGSALTNAIISRPADISPEVRERLRIIAGSFFNQERPV